MDGYDDFSAILYFSAPEDNTFEEICTNILFCFTLCFIDFFEMKNFQGSFFFVFLDDFFFGWSMNFLCEIHERRKFNFRREDSFELHYL